MSNRVDLETANSEGMGFFHGERKKAIERAAEKCVEVMVDEGLSVTQAEHLVSVISRKIKEKRNELLANTEIK